MKNVPLTASPFRISRPILLLPSHIGVPNFLLSIIFVTSRDPTPSFPHASFPPGLPIWVAAGGTTHPDFATTLLVTTDAVTILTFPIDAIRVFWDVTATAVLPWLTYSAVNTRMLLSPQVSCLTILSRPSTPGSYIRYSLLLGQLSAMTIGPHLLRFLSKRFPSLPEIVYS